MHIADVSEDPAVRRVVARPLPLAECGWCCWMTSALVAGCSQTLDSQSSTARTPLSVPSSSATSSASPAPGSHIARRRTIREHRARRRDRCRSSPGSRRTAAGRPEGFGSRHPGRGEHRGSTAVSRSPPTPSAASAHRDTATACWPAGGPHPIRRRGPRCVHRLEGQLGRLRRGPAWKSGHSTAIPAFVDGDGAALLGRVLAGVRRLPLPRRHRGGAVRQLRRTLRGAMGADGVDGFGCLSESGGAPRHRCPAVL